ncbi:MAG: hypothetical protein PSV16_14595 [Flavobacterium sp.]|nr:hypothetical protein [Flavobacterium sp.]
MSLQTREALKAFFLNGKKPPQANFHDWIDSYHHLSDGELVTSAVVDTDAQTVTINFTGGVAPLVFSTGGGPGSVTIEDVQGLTEALNDFVIKVPGQGLSQNNFTNTQVTQLQEAATGVSDIKKLLDTFVVKVPGQGLSQNNFTNTQVTQLQEAAAGVRDINNSLGNYVVKVTGQGLSQNNFTNTQVTQLQEAYAGVRDINNSLGNYVVKVTGQGLSQNNFTNAYLSQLQTLAGYIGFLQSYKGEIGLTHVTINEPIDASKQTIEQTLSAFATTITITAGKLLIVDYTSFPGKENRAITHNRAIYALPVNQYGNGHDAVSEQYKMSDTATAFTDVQRVTLDKQYSSFDIKYSGDNETITQTQNTFNDKVYEFIDGAQNNHAMLRGRKFTEGNDAEWTEVLKLQFLRGDVYKIETRVGFDETLAEGFNNIVQLDAVDLESDITKNRFYLYVTKDKGKYYFGGYLERATDYQNYIIKSFSSIAPAINNPDGVYHVTLEFRINDFMSNDLSAILTVNGERFEKDALNFVPIDAPYQLQGYPQGNRLAWKPGSGGNFCMHKLSYSINDEEYYFSLDQPGIIYSRDGVEMVINGTGETYFDNSPGAIMPIKMVNHKAQSALDFEDIHPDIATNQLRLENRLNSQDWDGKVYGEIKNNGDVVFYIDAVYIGPLEKFESGVFMSDLPGFFVEALGSSWKTTTGIWRSEGKNCPIIFDWDGESKKINIYLTNGGDRSTNAVIKNVICFNSYNLHKEMTEEEKKKAAEIAHSK